MTAPSFSKKPSKSNQAANCESRSSLGLRNDKELARGLHRRPAYRAGHGASDHGLRRACQRPIGSAVCESLEIGPALYECRRFPDGEGQIEIHESVRGHDVYLVQSTGPPADQHLMELLLLADACRRAGALASQP